MEDKQTKGIKNMALTDESMGTTMLVQPSNGGIGGGLFGGDLSILVLFFLFMMMGGWGNGFGGGFDGGLYPWMNNSQNINDGFRDQMIGNQISGIQNSITSGFGDVATALCGGFAGVNASINGAQNAITQQMYANTIADMERSFGVQTQLQNCCCENRAATADLKYTVATEACADRAAIGDALQAVIASSTANTQKILDRMCQAEIDSLKGQVVALQNQNNMLNLAASQTAQTAQLVADNTAQTQYIVNRVAPYPIPAYTVANPVTPAA
jgi:hypothetical protein